MPRYSWTQPICEKDWNKRFPFNPAQLMSIEREVEICAYCGEHTAEGIYIRDDPANVKFPKEKID